jgi:hypothetical protein
MFIERIDKRNVPSIVKVSRDPQDEPMEGEYEDLYMCDECGCYLTFPYDRVFYDVMADMHLCEDCKIVAEDEYSQTDDECEIVEI